MLAVAHHLLTLTAQLVVFHCIQDVLSPVLSSYMLFIEGSCFLFLHVDHSLTVKWLDGAGGHQRAAAAGTAEGLIQRCQGSHLLNLGGLPHAEQHGL